MSRFRKVIYLLNDHLSVILKGFQVWLECEMVVQWLDICRQDLSAARDVYGGANASGVEVFAHVVVAVAAIP